MASEKTSRVKTTETSFEVIEILLEDGPSTREHLEDRLGVTTSTVHRHLTTLQDFGYVTTDGELYRVGFRFLTIGGYRRRQVPAYSMIKRKVDNLAEETDERAQFIIREGGERVYLYTEIGDNPVQTGAYTGRRGPIYASAAGKSIIANLPERERNRLLAELDLQGTGPNTITETAALRDELADVRDRGYALNLQETTAGVHALGAPVRGDDGHIIGALSVSGPASRLKRQRLEEEILDLVLAAVNELELHIEHA